MGKKEKALFFIIVFFAIILRIYNLDKVPPELFGDEVDVGYQAYSVLKTGRDVYNQFLPSYFHSLSEWRAPLYLYATVPFVAVFGLNEWGIRLTAVFFGIISVILVYLVAKQLFKSPTVSLAAAAFLAFSPWHLQYSRAGFELTLLLSLILAGIYGFLRTLRAESPELLYQRSETPYPSPAQRGAGTGVRTKENKRWWFLTTVCFSLTFYTYSTAVLFVPLFCFFLWFLFRESARPGLKHLLPAMIILLPFLVNLVSGQARGRFETLSVTNLDQVTVNDLNFARNNAVNFWWKPKDEISLKVTGKIENFFHNKVLSAGQLFTNNYLSAFSPEFLFIWGDQNSNRHSIHQMGQFYLAEAVFLLGGLVWLLKNGLREKSGKLILMWLLLAPVPSALTRDGATHASRLFLMLPAITIIEAQGAVYLWQSLRRNFRQAVFSLIIVLFLFQTVFYFHRYYVHYPLESWRWWHYGFKEAMLFIKENSAGYDTVVINNTYEPALGRFLFWTSYDPVLLHEEFPKSLDKPQKQILPGIDAFVIGKKFYFGTTANPGNISAVLTPGMLYMVSQRDEVGGDWDWRKSPPSGVKVLKTVTNFYDEPIFYLATKE